MRRSSSLVRVSILALAASLGSPAAVLAANGSWTFNNSGNYSDAANWAGGVVPGSGGIATFGPVISANRGVTIDSSPTLSQINFDADFAYVLTGAGPLDLPGATLHTARPAADSAFILIAGSVIDAPISGVGGITKTGPGTLTLAGTNTYSGPTQVLGGTLSVTSGASALSVDQISLANNTTFRTATTALVTSAPIALTGNTRIEALVSTTLNGVISGSGSLTRAFGTDAINPLTFTLTADNTYNGNTTIRNGLITLSGPDGAIRSSPVLDVGGYFAISNAAGVNNNRLHPTLSLVSRGSRLTFGGDTAVNTSHTIPTLTLESGRTELVTSTNAATTNSVAIGTLVRNNRATLFLRGLTGTTTTVTVDTAVPTVGGTGTAGTTQLPIVPWIVANTAAGEFRINTTYVTYDTVTKQLRPLNVATEYLTTFAGATLNDNVRIAPLVGGVANPVVVPAGGISVNSLIIANQAGVSNSITVTQAASGSTLTVRSGAINTTPVNTLNSTTFEVAIDFGAAEGIVHNQSGVTLTFNRPISGTGGFTIGGTGLVSFGTSSTSSYTGTTTLIGGTVQTNRSILAGVNGPFGPDSSAIIMGSSSLIAGGGASARLLPNVSSTIDRPFIIRGNPAQPSVFGTTTSTNLTIDLNGGITLEGDLGLEIGATSNTLNFNGSITGPFRVLSVGTSQGTASLNASNSYSGGTQILNTQFIAGNDNAFGSGPITFATAGTANNSARIGAAGGARTLANDVVLRNNMVIVGGNALTFTGSINLGTGNPSTGGGPYIVNTPAPVTFTGNVFNGGLAKAGTSTLTLAGTNSYTGPTVVTAGRLNVNVPLRPVVGLLSAAATGSVVAFAAAPSASPVVVGEFSRIEISNSALASVAYTGRTSTAQRVLITGALNLITSGRIDLTNNDFIARGATLSDVRALIAADLLRSSVAGTVTADPRDAFTALAALANTDEFGLARFATFAGVAVSPTDTLVKYTYRGDTNLDGILDASDFNSVLSGITNALTGWDNGDINYDGVADAADYSLFLAAYTYYLSSGTPLASFTSPGAAIPEPASLALLAPALPLLLRRRR
jgi:fibronectin-binding autotransporter adhesin